MPLSPCTGIKSQNDETIREFVYANKYLSLSLPHRYNTYLGARLNSVEYHVAVEGGASRANSMHDMTQLAKRALCWREIFEGSIFRERSFEPDSDRL